MPYEQSSAKKKRIILSTHRKTNALNPMPVKQPSESHVSELREFHQEGGDHQRAINYASVNNSLEIFDEDPRNMHFRFLDNEEDKSEQNQIKGKSRVELLQTMHSTANMHRKTKNSENQPIQSRFSKGVGAISLSSLHSSILNDHKKRTAATALSRRFIDLTIKQDLKKLSHQSSESFLPERQCSNRSCIARGSIFQTQKSILSTVSVNSVQFTAVSSSERKKTLTITCHKYEGVKGKKVKTESMSKCNSIKLFRKCI